MAWAIKWRSENQTDGKREVLLGRFDGERLTAPPNLSGYTKSVFKTRKMARDYVRNHYSYIAKRPDLRREPHGWKAPLIVKVRVLIKEII